jgi:diacylglycerol kinase (ATP)
MADDKISILYNPSAGMGRALKRKIALERFLRHFGVRYDLVMTQSEDHLRQLTREHATQYGTLVGAGGDSTFHIMVNEISRSGADVVFGMIGVGSSNDVAREFGVGSLFEACRALKDGHIRSIDLGYVRTEGRQVATFLGQANIGLGAFVNKYVADAGARTPRLAKRQTLAGLLGIGSAFRTGAVPLRLTLESAAGRLDGEFVAAIFSNIRYWATGRVIAPAARPNDGALDACVIGRCSFLQLARIARLARRGRHGKARQVAFRTAEEFTIRSETPFEIQSDGEIVKTPDGRTSFREAVFGVLPRALKILSP